MIKRRAIRTLDGFRTPSEEEPGYIFRTYRHYTVSSARIATLIAMFFSIVILFAIYLLRFELIMFSGKKGLLVLILSINFLILLAYLLKIFQIRYTLHLLKNGKFEILDGVVTQRYLYKYGEYKIRFMSLNGDIIDELISTDDLPDIGNRIFLVKVFCQTLFVYSTDPSEKLEYI